MGNNNQSLPHSKSLTIECSNENYLTVKSHSKGKNYEIDVYLFGSEEVNDLLGKSNIDYEKSKKGQERNGLINKFLNLVGLEFKL